MRTTRSPSRVSFISTTNVSQLEQFRLLKPIPQGSSESLSESVKSGIHVEFKLSTQADEFKQDQASVIEQKGVSFDVSKPSDDVYEDIIALMQVKCKRILEEMKRKMYVRLNNSIDKEFFRVNRSTTGMGENPKLCRIWFYGENQHIRNKTNILTLNESMSKFSFRKIFHFNCFFIGKQRSKFVFAVLRREIPERYTIEITLPENKHKALLETIDGTIQI